MSSDVLAKVKMIPVIRALALISQGKTKVRACELAGISVDTLDNRLKENPLVVSDFLIEQRAYITSQYEEVIQARSHLLKDMIAAAMDSETSIKAKLAIEERLRQIQESMELELGLVSDDSGPRLPSPGSTATDAETFVQNKLAGPALRRGVSKATVRETTIEFELSRQQEPEEEAVEGEVLDKQEQ